MHSRSPHKICLRLAVLLFLSAFLPGCESPAAKIAFPKEYGAIEVQKKKGARIIKPVLEHMVKPAYSDAYRSGSVQYILKIGSDGKVQDVKIPRTAPQEYLEPIETATAQWRFQPGTVNGVPATFVMTGTMKFLKKTQTKTIISKNGDELEARTIIIRSLFPEVYHQWLVARDAGKNYTPPKAVNIVKPKYPDKRAEGQVYVAFIVDTSGLPKDIHIIGECPQAYQDSIRDAVVLWRFEPATINGKKLPSAIAVPVKFDLIQHWTITY